jgi:hypothetical protein
VAVARTCCACVCWQLRVWLLINLGTECVVWDEIWEGMAKYKNLQGGLH